MRSGLAVMLLPWVWGWLDLPSLPQMPGIDRLAGMIGGLCILTVVSLIFRPDKPPDRQEVRP